MSQTIKISQSVPVFQDYKTEVLISSTTNAASGYTSSAINCEGYSHFSVGIYYGTTSAVAHYNKIEASNDATNWYSITQSRYDTTYSNSNTHDAVYMNVGFIANSKRFIKVDEGGQYVFPCMWKYIRVKINSGYNAVAPVANQIDVDRLEVFLSK